MLGLELDFISELGIDSIRRVEIASKLIAAIPSLQQKNSPEDLSELIQLRSIQEICNWYQKKSSASALEDSVDEESHVRDISSYIPVNERYDVAGGAPIMFPDNGVVILIGAQSLYSDALVNSFKQRGVCSLLVSGESFEWVGNEITSSKTLLDISSVVEVEELLSSSELSPVGLFFVGSRSEHSLQHMCSKNFFEVLQLVQRRISDRFDSFPPMLGSFTFEGASAEEAGPTAILKTLAREDDRFRVRCLQFSQEVQREKFVMTIWELFQIEEDLQELIVTPAGKFKSTVALRNEERVEKAILLSSDSVLVITGGLSGVTFEVTRALLRKYSTKLVVLGRTPLSESSERQANYIEIEKLASTLRYVLCDVGDEDALSACIKEIYETEGRIDGIIHGAGIIRDSLIRDKFVSDFVDVYRTKTQILPVLERELRPAELQFLVLFSSVAGQFGSIGQADYAAANAVLNSWAVSQQAVWKDSKVVSINWGPWSGGMMSAELQKLYSAAGVELISLKKGGELFLKELESSEGDCPIVILSGSLDIIASHSIGHTSEGSFQ
jgi:NAD(P)-dependent dehydrogenase (short-subunit alcohol dehydrogenase family)